MRARLVRPGYWEDATIGKLPVRTRLTYIGLWGVADDAGFFEWKVDEIAAALFRFESSTTREKALTGDLERLVAAGRIRRFEDCNHGLIPTLVDHRIAGGNQNERIKKAHIARCTDKYVPVPPKVDNSVDSGDKSPSEREDVQVRTSTDKSRSESLSSSLSLSSSPSETPIKKSGKNGVTKIDEIMKANGFDVDKLPKAAHHPRSPGQG